MTQQSARNWMAHAAVVCILGWAVFGHAVRAEDLLETPQAPKKSNAE